MDRLILLLLRLVLKTTAKEIQTGMSTQEHFLHRQILYSNNIHLVISIHIHIQLAFSFRLIINGVNIVYSKIARL